MRLRRARPAAEAARSGACAALLLASLTACVNTSELQFTQDDRLDFTSPDFNAMVEVPVTVTWTMDDFTVVPDGPLPQPSADEGLYAVFVDQAPVAPGASLREVGDGDPACEATPRCPDRRYLAAKGVYVTAEPELVLATVTPLASRQDVQTHQVTVVLVDSAGDRIGESAWFTQFKMKNLVNFG